MQIAEVARKKQGDDLTRAARRDLVAAGEAAEDEVNTIRSLALLDDIPPRSHAMGILDQLVEQLLVFDAEVREVVEFASEQIHGRARGDKPVKFKAWSAWPPCCQDASGLLEPHVQEFAPESRDEGRRAQAALPSCAPAAEVPAALALFLQAQNHFQAYCHWLGWAGSLLSFE